MGSTSRRARPGPRAGTCAVPRCHGPVAARTRTSRGPRPRGPRSSVPTQGVDPERGPRGVPGVMRSKREGAADALDARPRHAWGTTTGAAVTILRTDGGVRRSPGPRSSSRAAATRPSRSQAWGFEAVLRREPLTGPSHLGRMEGLAAAKGMNPKAQSASRFAWTARRESSLTTEPRTVSAGFREDGVKALR